MRVVVRPSTQKDAERVAALGREFGAYLRALGDPAPRTVTAEEYLRDGFGPRPEFAGLVAELEAEAVGYLLYCPAYDLDWGGRFLYISDLYVCEKGRRRGAGRALMEAAARICRELGGHELLWAVYPRNALAQQFFERLGAREVEGLRYMHSHSSRG